MVGVGGGELVDVRIELGHREDVEAGVDFVDFLLRGAGGFFFDDGADVGPAGGFTKHSAVAGRVDEVGAEERHRRVLRAVKGGEILNRSGGDEGRVAGEHDDLVIRLERLAGGHERVASAALFRLQNKIDARVADGLANAVSLVSDDYKDVGGGHDLAGSRDDVRQDRLARDFMEHFRVPGFKPSTFAGRHDGDGGTGWRQHS